MVTTANEVKKQTSSSTEKKIITKIPLGLSHLVTGFVTFDRSGKIILDPKSPPLETLRNRIFCIKDSKGDFKTLISNEKGVVNNLKAKSIIADNLEFRGVVGKNNLEKEIFMAPPEAVKVAYMSHVQDANKEWSDVLIDFFKSKQPKGMKLQVIPLYKNYFRVPNADSKDEDEIQYKKWYQKFESGERHTGILFAKVRSVFLLFNSPKDIIEKVTIFCPDSSLRKGEEITLPVKEDGDISYCVFVGSNAELTVGNYTIKVKIAGASDEWCKNVRTEGSYTLVETIRYNIHNLAGDFDIISCDPITLEDAMIRQYPVMLNHITKVIKDDINKDKKENTNVKFSKIKNKGVIHFGKNMHWAMDKANIFLGAADESGYKRYSQFALLISSSLEAGDSKFAEANKTLKLVFGTMNTYKQWKDYLKPYYLILTDKGFSDMAAFIKNNTNGFYQSDRWLNALSNAYKDKKFPQKIIDLRRLEKNPKRLKQTLQQFSKMFPDEVKALERRYRRPGKGISEKIGKIGVGLSVIDLGLQIASVYASHEELKKNVKENHELFVEYIDKINGLPCKEVMDLCEKYRAATVGGRLKYEKEAVEAFSKAFDTALCVVALTPTPAGLAANIIILAISTYNLVSDLWTAGQDALDDYFHDSYYKEKKVIDKMLARVSNGAGANQRLMPTRAELKSESEAGKVLFKIQPSGTTPFEMKVGPHYYHMQYRIRAEVLYGLMNLIMMASIKSEKDNESSFKKQCEEYKVAEYIQHFVFSDEWCFDITNNGRISLDTWWLSKTSKYVKTFTVVAPLVGMWALSFSLANYQTTPKQKQLTDAEKKKQMAIRPLANFQRHFPVHKYVSDDLFSFAKYFTPVDILGNTKDWIERTFVYYRGKDSTSDGDWCLINEGNNASLSDLQLLSPFSQIRVLIVLKETNAKGKKLADGIFPINLQIYRTDGSNCSGPVYRNIVRILDDDMLLNNTHEFDYMGEKRRGTVFYPFYDFGEQTIFGAKPLINSDLWRYSLGGVFDGIFRWGGGYGITDMTYAFSVKLGKTNQDAPWVKLGSKDENNELNEFRLGVNLSDPEEKKLEEPSFLVSNSTDYVLPKLFDGHRVLFQYYIKIGDKMHSVQAGYKKNIVLEINDFNWNDKVEIYLLLSVRELLEDDYKATNWRSVPAKATLCNSDDGRDAKGQDYATRFHYLGDYKVPEGNGMFINVKDPLTLRANSKYNKPDAISLLPKKGTFDDFIKYFNWKEGLKRTSHALDKAFANYDHAHLFVAKLEMQYANPVKKDEIIKGLRPIAKKQPIKGSGYFNYTIRNVISAGDTDLYRQYTEYEDKNSKNNRTFLEVLGHKHASTELTLKVKAPKDYDKNVPWTGLSKQEIGIWLNEYNSTIKIK